MKVDMLINAKYVLPIEGADDALEDHSVAILEGKVRGADFASINIRRKLLRLSLPPCCCTLTTRDMEWTSISIVGLLACGCASDCGLGLCPVDRRADAARGGAGRLRPHRDGRAAAAVSDARSVATAC